LVVGGRRKAAVSKFPMREYVQFLSTEEIRRTRGRMGFLAGCCVASLRVSESRRPEAWPGDPVRKRPSTMART
jgi:hypothetical protein